MISFKKRQLMLREDYASKSGIEITEMGERLQSPKERLYNCLLKGLMTFITVYCLNMLFITSFELSCSKALITFGAVILSFGVSLFYYNKLCFNLGFIGLFLVFLPISFGLVMYANSGMNAIVNILFEAVDKKLNLEGVRHYQEIYSNRFMTITCCLFLLLFLEVCFLNAFISEHLSGFLVALFVYPVIQICMYLCDIVQYKYIFPIVFVIIMCMIMRHSERFRPILSKKYPGCIIKKNLIGYNPANKQESSLLYKITGMILPAFLIIFLLAVAALRLFPYTARNNNSSWKNSTDEIVSEVAMHGLSSLFMKDEYSPGGILHGRLGEVKEVYQDFETDLKVSYVPFSSEVLYLRSFTGTTYFKNSWTYHSSGAYASEMPYFEAEYWEQRYLQNADPSAFAVMQIRRVDPIIIDETFQPYCAADMYQYYLLKKTEEDNPKLFEHSPLLQTWSRLSESDSLRSYSSYLYYPVLSEEAAVNAGQYDQERNDYRDYVYSKYYLQIPEELRPVLEQICEEEGFHGTTMEIVEQIQAYFNDNFVYTLAPGRTPKGRDFVQYFLKKKKGYCTHFATTGALLLRCMGIPTCYVEGYAIDVVTAADASEILENEDPDKWYDGDNFLNSASGDQVPVLEVEVSDAHAHAWVMVYLDGYGWYPVELTTAAAETSGEDEDFWSNFGRLFTGNNNGTSPIELLTKQAQRIGSGFLKMIIAAAILFGCIIIFRIGYRKFNLYLLPSNRRLSNQYILLNKLLNRYYLKEPVNVYHLVSVEIGKKLGLEEQDLTTYASLTERASYGKDELSRAELKTATGLFRKYIRKLRSRVKMLQKIGLMMKV
ncbi:MAG: transglutaminase domain-containing protein [Lachnospiraceae bacterium]|nr:transglutaminase domain-containing protein [Lachnospiraceae bacterium]